MAGGPTSLPSGRDHYPTSSSVPHSNSNSYNQYNQSYHLNPARFVPGGEVPPPRPLPPSTLTYNNNNTAAPPRPDPPAGYTPPAHNSTSAKPSAAAPADRPGPLQVIVTFLEI